MSTTETPEVDPDREFYAAVADELNDGRPGDCTLDDLDAGYVAAAERYAARKGYPWPPAVGDFDEFCYAERLVR